MMTAFALLVFLAPTTSIHGEHAKGMVYGLYDTAEECKANLDIPEQTFRVASSVGDVQTTCITVNLDTQRFKHS